VTRQNPIWLQDLTYPASVDRALLGALWPIGGVDGCKVTATGSGMGVNIGPGSVAIPAANGTGSVLCHSDAVETLTLDPAEPAGTNRVDRVICQAHGADLDGGTVNDFVFAIVKGAPGGGMGAVPAGAVLLAEINVVGGSAAVDPAKIYDHRAPLRSPTRRVRAHTNNTHDGTANQAQDYRYEIVDTNTFGADAYNTGTGIFTAPVAGWHRIHAWTRTHMLQYSNGTVPLNFSIVVNGTTRGHDSRPYSRGSDWMDKSLNVSCDTWLAVGDTAKITIYWGNTGNTPPGAGVNGLEIDLISTEP